jgi:hypothetical protein
MTAVELPPVPPRMARLSVDARGYPVPWFVPWFDAEGNERPAGDGTPDFRRITPGRIATAIIAEVCWICGDRMGAWRTFVLGPMCAINRVTSEPPSHRDCADFAARACPFLVRPKMGRVEKNLGQTPGIALARNPGVALVWTTRTYRAFRAQQGGHGVLFDVGAPDHVRWYAEGRPATRQEVLDSIESGYPSLLALAEQDGPAAMADLEAKRIAALAYVPA